MDPAEVWNRPVTAWQTIKLLVSLTAGHGGPLFNRKARLRAQSPLMPYGFEQANQCLGALHAVRELQGQAVRGNVHDLRIHQLCDLHDLRALLCITTHLNQRQITAVERTRLEARAL